MFEKQVKIHCSWIPIEGKSTTNGHAWRSWTISLEASRIDLSEYIDHVEYILHESFGSPPIVRKEPPYALQREGWGEFDLLILFYFKDLSLPSPQTIIFDLNFKKPRYHKYKKIALISEIEYIEEDFIEEEYAIKAPLRCRRRPSRFSSRNTYGKKLENVTKRQRAISSSSSSSTSSSTAAHIKEYNRNVQQDQEKQYRMQQQEEQQQKQVQHQHQNQYQYKLHQCKQKTASTLPYYILDPKNDLSLVLETKTIDLRELKALLEALDESNLRNVFKIIFSYDRSTQITKETDDGYYMIDITCACSDLINELWEFVIDVEIEKCKEGFTLYEGVKEQH